MGTGRAEPAGLAAAAERGARVGPAQVAGLSASWGGAGGRVASVEGVREGDSDGQVRGQQTSSPS